MDWAAGPEALSTKAGGVKAFLIQAFRSRNSSVDLEVVSWQERLRRRRDHGFVHFVKTAESWGPGLGFSGGNQNIH